MRKQTNEHINFVLHSLTAKELSRIVLFLNTLIPLHEYTTTMIRPWKHLQGNHMRIGDSVEYSGDAD